MEVLCTSKVCLNNKNGKCVLETVELDGNGLNPSCQSVKWDPNDINIEV